MNTDRQQVPLLVFLDLSAMFDTVDHQVLWMALGWVLGYVDMR